MLLSRPTAYADTYKQLSIGLWFMLFAGHDKVIQ